MVTQTEPATRCACCRLGTKFRPTLTRAEGWWRCENCGHNAIPQDTGFKCTLRKVLALSIRGRHSPRLGLVGDKF